MVALGTKLLEMNVSDSEQQTPTETNLKDGAPRQVSQGHPWGSAEASCHSDLRCQAEATSTSLFILCERLTSPMRLLTNSSPAQPCTLWTWLLLVTYQVHCQEAPWHC